MNSQRKTKMFLLIKKLIATMTAALLSLPLLLYAAAGENGIALISIKPKILTPLKQDGLNDRVIFTFAPEPTSKLCLKIFSLDGITVVKDVEYNFDGSGTISWDGKSNTNNYVQPGIYIYQIEADGKIINGTLIVAR